VVVTDLQDKHDAYAAAAVALTKSGTSTLGLALAGVPMAVTYRVNPISAAIARRLVLVRHAALVNLLADRSVVPELIQGDCTPTRLAAEIVTLLTDPAAAAAQRASFRDIIDSLAPPSGTPSMAACREVLDLLDRTPDTKLVTSVAS
jgi:lipid-A-disaccharide synthase